MTPATRSALLVALCAGCGTTAPARPFVRHLLLEGVRSVDAADLRHRLALREPSLWPFFAGRTAFDPYTLASDAVRIEAYYRAHGYFEAAVVGTDVRHVDDRSVEVRVAVHEGPPTRVEDVTITGLERLGSDGRLVADAVTLHRGEVLDHARYLVEKAALVERLRTVGYAFADATGDVAVDREHRTARITIAATPGAKCTVGLVTVRGASPGNERAIVRHAALEAGEPFSTVKLEGARSAVYNLGFFSSVKVAWAPASARPDVADVTLTVVEGPRSEIRLGAGFGLDGQRTEVRGRAQLTRRNLAGGLRTLRLRLEPAWVAIPAFWAPERQGPAALAEVELTQQDVLSSTDQALLAAGYQLGLDYAFAYHGPRAQLAYARTFLNGRLQLDLSYDFEHLFLFDTDPAILALPDAAARWFGYREPYRLGWFEESLAFDARDRPLEPRKGFYVALSGEEGGVYAGGAFTYEKVGLDARVYWPVVGRLVVAARTRVGQIFSHGDVASPITRRFYLGGPESHRGFNYDRLAPQVRSGRPGAAPLPVGGDQLFLTQIELRYGLVELWGSWLAGGLFLDAGDVGAPACAVVHPGDASLCEGIARGARTTISLGQLHYAAGAGLRYKTVIGTVRADVGVRLNRYGAVEPDGTPNPDPGARLAFHLSIGEAF